MYREDLTLSDGRLFYTVLHHGELEEDIEYQMKPYYDPKGLAWVYPISSAHGYVIASGPDESITHKFTNIN